MTPAAPDILQLHKLKPLSPAVLAMIAFGVCLLFLGGQYIGLPVVIFPVLAIFATAGLYFARSASAALRLFIGTSFALAFRMATTQDTDVIDILAGLAMGGVLMVWCTRLLIIERESLTFSTPQLIAALFIAWGLFIGIGGMLWWNNALNDWVREMLILCPIVVVPMLYARVFEPDTIEERKFHRFIAIASLAVMISGMGKYAIALTQSSYAYQIGRIAAEQSPGIVLLLACLAFSLHKVTTVSIVWRLLLSAVCFALLILSGYRTLWVAVAVVTVIMFLMTETSKWSRGVKFLLSLAGIIAAVGTYMFYTVRIFQIFVLMTYGRLISTTAVSTDPSLINRYIETAMVEKHVMQSPLVGYGLGAQYQTFDWLLGYSYNTGFSHNGYYFVAFKTGIVGFALFFTAFVWFMVKAFRMARDTSEVARTRAIASVAFCYFCCQLISNLTLNFFGERNAMIWFGLFWGFIITREIAKRRRSSPELALADVS